MNFGAEAIGIPNEFGMKKGSDSSPITLQVPFSVSPDGRVSVKPETPLQMTFLVLGEPSTSTLAPPAAHATPALPTTTPFPAAPSEPSLPAAPAAPGSPLGPCGPVAPSLPANFFAIFFTSFFCFPVRPPEAA